MTGQPDFRIDVDQNEYLPEDGREVHAIVTVTSTKAPAALASAAAMPASAAATPDGAAEVILIDASGSMAGNRLAEAKQATATAIDVLRDGVMFAVVAGTHEARMVYPIGPGLVPASEATRAAAKAELKRLRAFGGTAIGTWLLQAQRLFAKHGPALRHAILLTDGKDEHETPEQLAAMLRDCEGQFSCDCRGVGTDWVVSELRTIASALLGSVDIVADPAGLGEDFRSMMAIAMDKTVADVTLRLWTPQDATVRFLKQVAPTIEDLTGRRVEAGPRTGNYPTGSWGAETREYHVCVEVPPGGLGDEMLAGRMSLVRSDSDGGEQILAQGRVRAVWTDDMALSTRLDPKVADATGQAELAASIQQGLEAYRAGDRETATARLTRAMSLAREAGNEDTARLLEGVVDLDPDTGTFRLKSKVSAEAEMTLDARSTKTARLRRG